MDSISRAMFEDLNDDLFRSTLNSVLQVLRDAGVEKSYVTDIVLVGGSTRIPRIRQLLQEFFGGKQPSNGVDPDEAVVRGAAINTAVYRGDIDALLIDNISHSLGVDLGDGNMNVIFPLGISFPAKKSELFTVAVKNQPSIEIHIYEGEKIQTKDASAEEYREEDEKLKRKLKL